MRFCLALALALPAASSWAQTLPPLPAATVLTDAAGDSAYAVPFASKGNRIELAVPGLDGVHAEVVAVPAWLRLATPSVEDGTVSVAFDVLREASVNTPGVVRMRFTALNGRTIEHTVRLAVEPPHEVLLDNPRPNPSRGRAEIGYALPSVQRVRLGVYDVLGREVLRLRSGEEEGAGFHRAEVSGLAAGVYLVRLVAGAAVRTTRLVRR